MGTVTSRVTPPIIITGTARVQCPTTDRRSKKNQTWSRGYKKTHHNCPGGPSYREKKSKGRHFKCPSLRLGLGSCSAQIPVDWRRGKRKTTQRLCAVPTFAGVYTQCQTLLPRSQKDRPWLKDGDWAQLLYLLFSNNNNPRCNPQGVAASNTERGRS